MAGTFNPIIEREMPLGERVVCLPKAHLRGKFLWHPAVTFLPSPGQTQQEKWKGQAKVQRRLFFTPCPPNDGRSPHPYFSPFILSLSIQINQVAEFAEHIWNRFRDVQLLTQKASSAAHKSLNVLIKVYMVVNLEWLKSAGNMECVLLKPNFMPEFLKKIC